jgi:hypothetical protein
MDAMTAPDAADRSQPETGDDAACWRHAERLRDDHPGWVIIWLAPASEYRAYKLPGPRRDTTLAAPTPDGLAAAITTAEQALPKIPSQRGQQ